MKPNSGGLILCAIYAVYAAAMLAAACFAVGPSRHLPISFASIPAVFAFHALHARPWMYAPYLLVPASLLIAYLIGWGISATKRRLTS